MRKKIEYSPNFSKKSRRKQDIKFVIIHYTGMQSEIESLNRLKNPNSKVSCHYLISRNGRIIQLVKDNKIAWHAGKSKWSKFKNLNKFSIGIELVNKGSDHGYEKFTNLQINYLIKLCKILKKKYQIKKENFLGHSDVSPLRKIDPGEKFPWKKLSKNQLGTWYNLKKVKFDFSNKFKIKKLFFKNLHKIGYRYIENKINNKKKFMIIKAFQRRYHPKGVSGKIDRKTYKISHFLANINKFT